MATNLGDKILVQALRSFMRRNNGIMPRDEQKLSWLSIKVHIGIVCVLLYIRNRISQTRITSEDGSFVISLTSHGPRVDMVYLTLETIALSSASPKKVIVWVSQEDYERAQGNARVARLVERGVEVRTSENFGPHTKYFPWVATSSRDEFEVGLITADDDVLYPCGWLDGFEAARAASPQDCPVLCYRGCDVGDGRLTGSPYSKWPLAGYECADSDLFPTGVSGVLYPASVLEECKRLGAAFRTVCPRADDIWLHAVRLRGAPEARLIDRRGSLEWWPVPTAHRSGLFRDNVSGGGNDAVLVQTLDWMAGRRG